MPFTGEKSRSITLLTQSISWSFYRHAQTCLAIISVRCRSLSLPRMIHLRPRLPSSKSRRDRQLLRPLIVVRVPQTPGMHGILRCRLDGLNRRGTEAMCLLAICRGTFIIRLPRKQELLRSQELTTYCCRGLGAGTRRAQQLVQAKQSGKVKAPAACPIDNSVLLSSIINGISSAVGTTNKRGRRKRISSTTGDMPFEHQHRYVVLGN